ncbi:MAG TPA: exo-alpha-sialidase [Polyangiaceae bacterium]|nr:exo-alpha-sialidase [Polyangiaceae bacterium]
MGDPCTLGEFPEIQGSCPDGLVCFPSEGGYCTKACGLSSCPAGSTCVPTLRSGEMCSKACETDADCRQAEGYACHPDYQACVQWLVSPLLPTCGAPALTRNAFGTVTQLSTSAGPGIYNMEPGARLDASGNLTAVYMARNEAFENGTLGVSTLTAAGTVDGDRELTSSSTNLFDVWMANDRNGGLHLVWFGHDGLDTNSRIDYATSSDGFTWSAPTNLLQPADCPNGQPGCTDKPMIAIGPDPVNAAQDNIYVFHGSSNGERVSRSTDGGATFTPTAILSGAGVYGDAEVASDGSLHFVSAVSNGDRLGDTANAIRYHHSEDGGLTFAPVVAVEEASEPTPLYFSNAQVAFNPGQGSVHVVYPTGTPDGEWNIRLATSMDAGNTWSRITVNDDASCANHATPTIALDEATGTLHVAWIENRSGTGAVAYTRCLPDGSSCAPNEAISDTPFASYVLVRHSPKWMGEYFELLVDPAQQEIHAVWAQPVMENGIPIARIFHSKAAL